MNNETPEQRVKREIENDIKQVLKAINKNRTESERLASVLQELFVSQECKHEWEDTGSFILSTSQCKKCHKEDSV